MSISELEISNGLCLDVEDNKPDSNHSQISINNLKANVIIGNKTLVLVGIIAFEKSIGKNTLRHYVAYCRNLQGCWKKCIFYYLIFKVYFFRKFPSRNPHLMLVKVHTIFGFK